MLKNGETYEVDIQNNETKEELMAKAAAIKPPVNPV
jgi:hypothetical protein